MKEIFYDWGGVNVTLFHIINNIHSEFLDRFMLMGTALGDHHNFSLYFSLLALTAFVALARMPAGHGATSQKSQALRWMAAVAVFSVAYLADGWLIGVLKPLLDFPRPPLALPVGTVNIVGQAEFHHSLPSGHASFAMLFVASLWPILNRRWRVAGIFFVLWVGISRISLGMHFPADVLAGFALSLAVVMLVFWVVQKLGSSLSK